MAILLIPPAVVATATLSGMFGMGGGMVLMGVYASLLPITAAMVLHGITQLASNGYRAYLLRAHARWSVLGFFALGGAVSVALMSWLAVTADRDTLFLLLGGLPLTFALVPRGWAPNIESRAVAFAFGAVAIATQLIAGASGPLLDVLFVRARFSRHQTVATKAVVSAGGHLVKVVYYTALVPADQLDLPLWIFPVAILLALVGTRVGKALLDRLSEDRFRALSTALIAAISITFVLRGAWGLMQ